MLRTQKMNDGDASISFSKAIRKVKITNSGDNWIVTPHPVPVGRQMAVEYGLNLRDVRMASFRSINVPGSPTLIFADEKGRVLQAWIGKVSPDGEREVFHVLGISRVTHGAGPAGATSPKSEVAVAVPARLVSRGVMTHDQHASSCELVQSATCGPVLAMLLPD